MPALAHVGPPRAAPRPGPGIAAAVRQVTSAKMLAPSYLTHLLHTAPRAGSHHCTGALRRILACRSCEVHAASLRPHEARVLPCHVCARAACAAVIVWALVQGVWAARSCTRCPLQQRHAAHNAQCAAAAASRRNSQSATAERACTNERICHLPARACDIFKRPAARPRHARGCRLPRLHLT